MNKMALSVAGTVLASAITGGLVFAIEVHSDVQMLKAHSHKVDADLRSNAEATKEFTKLMIKLDTTLDHHRQAIEELKNAIKRLEAPKFAYYVPEDHNDG